MNKIDTRVTIPGRQKPIVRHHICVPVAPMHPRADALSGLDSQLVFGTAFDIFKIEGEWAWGQEVQNDNAGYVGFVPCAALSELSEMPTHSVSVLKAPVFSKPDLKSPIRYVLPLNAIIALDRREGVYLHASGIGYLHSRHVSKLSGRDGDYVSMAELHIALPYIWGGVSSDGLDCSGLVQSSLRAVGRDAPRDSDMQEQALGKPIEKSDGLQRGDLVFWKGHVGIMTDSETLLHANAYHMAVVSEPLNEAARRIEKTAGPITSFKRLD